MDAEIFFNFLFKNGYTRPFAWKNINKQTEYYEVSFCCEKCKTKAIHRISIEVFDAKHTIRKDAIYSFCEKHNLL